MLEETTEELKRCVCERLNTTLEQVERDVDCLQDWLRTQPHLPQCSSKLNIIREPPSHTRSAWNIILGFVKSILIIDDKFKVLKNTGGSRSIHHS